MDERWCEAADATEPRGPPARWSPEVNARFGMIIQPTHGLVGGLVTVPFLSRFGSKKAYEYASLLGVLGMLGWAYAWTGAGMARHFLQYAVTDICLNSWTAQVLNSSVRAMVIKQGIEVCKDAGKGELNAAYGGLGMIMGPLHTRFTRRGSVPLLLKRRCDRTPGRWRGRGRLGPARLGSRSWGPLRPVAVSMGVLPPSFDRQPPRWVFCLLTRTGLSPQMRKTARLDWTCHRSTLAYAQT